ncbi:MAG: TfoX/Sxy family protein [Christensenellales bacterium]
MAASLEYVEFVCDRINGAGDVRFKKMFGEYMVYVNNKPLLLVCDDTVYVKKLDALGELMRNAPLGMPYNGAKEHYILDIDDDKLTRSVIDVLEPITPIPAPRNKKAAKSAT